MSQTIALFSADESPGDGFEDASKFCLGLYLYQK
jgi:hypothetical protein